MFPERACHRHRRAFYEILERVGADLGDLLDAVFVAQQSEYLLVEDLPGELTGLHEDDAAVFRVGVIAEVRALVDETFAIGIDHDAPRVGVLLEVVADRKVTELGRIAVPAYGVAAGPVSVGIAPISSAMRMPSPVLKRVPRIFANSQPGPR